MHHFHLYKEPCLPEDLVVPREAVHLHQAAANTEAEIVVLLPGVCPGQVKIRRIKMEVLEAVVHLWWAVETGG